MWIVKLALNRPYTFIVLALLIFVLSPLVILRTPTDIFPDIDIPVISVAWTYTGLNPEDVEARLTTPYEKVLTTLVDNIEHIESTTYNGSAVIKIFLQPRTSLDRANSQVVSASQFVLRFLPPAIQPPEIINFSASSVPILQLGLSGKGLSEQQLNDLTLIFVRTQLITVPVAVLPLPYGGKQRYVSVDLNYQKLQALNMTPSDVVNAMGNQNLILPSGTMKIGPFEYQVMVPEAVRRQIQLRTGQDVTLHITEYFEGNSAGSRFVPRRIGFNTEAELDFFEANWPKDLPAGVIHADLFNDNVFFLNDRLSGLIDF